MCTYFVNLTVVYFVCLFCKVLTVSIIITIIINLNSFRGVAESHTFFVFFTFTTGSCPVKPHSGLLDTEQLHWSGLV